MMPTYIMAKSIGFFFTFTGFAYMRQLILVFIDWMRERIKKSLKLFGKITITVRYPLSQVDDKLKKKKKERKRFLFVMKGRTGACWID